MVGPWSTLTTGYAPWQTTVAPRALGQAFQLTNFLRDINEDLDRGRVYLPQEDLARHGADPWLRRVTPQWRGSGKWSPLPVPDTQAPQ